MAQATLRRAAQLGAAVLAAAATAGAVGAPPCTECFFGATNTHAVAGHGRLTAAFAEDGDLTVLSWPSPSLSDQLAYFSSNADDARDQPHVGALDGMGSYVGLWVTRASGPQLTWLRDAGWSHAQSYSAPDSAVPVTRFENGDLGLVVTLTDVVIPETDVLVRHLAIERGAGSPVTGLSLAVYENLSPSLGRLPMLPVVDWLLESKNDWLAVWDEEAGGILHFRPGDRNVVTEIGNLLAYTSDHDYGAVEALVRRSDVADADAAGLVAGLDASYAPGVAGLVATDPPAASHQVGNDATPLCARLDVLIDNVVASSGGDFPVDPSTANLLRCRDDLTELAARRGWLWQPEDALADLADGALSGSPVAVAQTNGALMTPLALDGDRAQASIFFAFGETRAEARAALDEARAKSFADHLAASEQATAAAIADAPLPDPELGDRVVAVARRALVNLTVARDDETGAIVASVARQAPYYLDWPRDGAFFSAALDMAGRGDWVGQRAEWYVPLARSGPEAPDPLLGLEAPADPDSGEIAFPAASWEMNYYQDGTPGGPIRFQIDNTALHVWATVSHAARLEGDARARFLDAVWPSDRAALDLLARWREPDTGLPAPANEDDDSRLTSRLHGAVATYTALVAGARLARHLGEDETFRRWLDRADELRAAIFEHYLDPETQRWRIERGGEPGPTPEGQEYQETAWIFWPARLVTPDDPSRETQLTADLDEVLALLRGERPHGRYVAKAILAAALQGRDGGSRDQAREALGLLADVATEGTDHFGEDWVLETAPDGTARLENRVDMPHVWEGTLFYLSAMALTDRSLFDPEVEAFPLPGDPATEGPPAGRDRTEGSGCGCRAAGAPSGRLGAAWLLLCASLVGRRRARR